MTDGVSRRGLLRAGATAGLVVLAGCADDPETPSVDLDEQAALDIAEIELPEDMELFPISISDEVVDERVERIESLLAPLPADLESEIPNEAVREHIEDRRSRATEALAEDQPSNYARLSRLKSARRRAADAEGSYAVVDEDRPPAVIEDELPALESDLDALRTDLSWTGDELEAAAVVYDSIEQQLSQAERALNEAAEDRPNEPDFERVGYLSARRERALARLDDAGYILDQQTDRAEQSFEQTFEEVVSTQLEDHRELIEELPTTFDDATEMLFGEPTDLPVHEDLARQLINAPNSTYDSVRENLENDHPAQAVVDVLHLESDLLAIEYVKSDDDLVIERPEDDDDIEAAKRTAIEAIETAASSAENPYFLGKLLNAARNDIQRSDEGLEQYRSEADVTWSTASYLVATVRARVAAEATEQLVSSFPD